MDGRSDHPTHVVARERIERQIVIWGAEHSGWRVELNVPLEFDDSDVWARLVMVKRFDDDPLGQLWYSTYVITRALLVWLGDPKVSFLAVADSVNRILLDLQREIGVMRGSGT